MIVKLKISLLVAGVLLTACDPSIPNTPPTAVVVARFDPAASVIPTPNDLLTNPATGNTQIPIPASASGADKIFYAYLNQLNGFPASSGALSTFDAPVDEASVTDQTVRVFDVTDSFKPVTVTRTVSDYEAAIVPAPTDGGPETATYGRLGIAAPTAGWVPGHTYAVAIIGGSGGVKAKDGRPVVASATWAFLRNENPLVTCADPAGPLTKDNCVAATNIIPSGLKEDPAARLADQTKSALQLEPLRLKYKAAIAGVVAAGVARSDLALLWTFKVAQKVSIAFDPTMSVIPLPNDLLKDPATGLLKVPVLPTDSPAAAEFTTDYLNTLDGFPVSAGASALAQGGALDPATVNADTVKVLVLKGDALAADPTIGYDAAKNAITIAPAGGSWGKARTLGVAIVGGAKGVKTADGKTVVGSQVWAIVRSGSPLVDCTDLTSPDCKALLTAAPVSLAQAKALEGLRRGYSPALALLAAGTDTTDPIARTDVALFWTFSTSSFPEATFDPAGSIIPFPNDILRSPTTGKLALPIPAGAPALLQNLLGGLNTLDGFSLNGAVVSENSDTKGAIDLGSIDPATLDAGTGFIKASNPNGLQPNVTRCLNCASTLQADGGAQTLQQLQFVPKTPLEEQTTYAAFVTTDLKNTDGKPVVAAPTFALLRLKNPLIDAGGKATLTTITDAQAGQLEPLRLAGKASLDGLEAGLSIPRKKVSLAWAFKTQSTVSTLQGLHDVVAAPTTAGGGLSTVPTAVAPVPIAALPAALPKAALAAQFFVGNIFLPNAINTPQGVLNPNPATWGAQKAPFLLFVPTGTPPAAGWPVVIYGHGLGGDRQQASAIANSFAVKGYATLAVDVILHGERNTCVGVGEVLKAQIPNATDDYACTLPGSPVPDPVNNRCEPTTGRCERRATGEATAPAVADCTVGGDLACLAAGQGYCRANNKCEGAAFLKASATATAPAFNSWNFLNLANLFATRDNFRHTPMDFNQLVRVVQSTAAGNLSSRVGTALAYGGPALDGATISYSSLSLGSFNGTLFSAVNPVVRNFALSVPGADQTDALLTAPAFAAQRAGFLGSLAALGVVPGTPSFDNFIVLTRTILDPADPQNFIYAGVNRAAPATRKMYLQYITFDQVLPNSGTFRLIGAAQRGTAQATVRELNPSLTDLPPASRHGISLNFTNPALTIGVQTQLANFVATGAE